MNPAFSNAFTRARHGDGDRLTTSLSFAFVTRVLCLAGPLRSSGQENPGQRIASLLLLFSGFESLQHYMPLNGWKTELVSSYAHRTIQYEIERRPNQCSIVASAMTTSLNLISGARDTDPNETQEWLESLDAILRSDGPERCVYLLQKLYAHARGRGLQLNTLVTPYGNTISAADQPEYPGDLELEKRLTAIIRWNALVMVTRANNESSELGGHLSSYASGADLFEVGFNHFFHGDAVQQGTARTADLIFFQPHSAPGIYARAFLEGRLTEQQLVNFRREVGGKGLSSYPHPQLMPNFWQFPTGSMGLGPLAAIYQARFMRYLDGRGLLNPAGRRVWAFVGDGEMDEPESIAGLTLPRERTWTILLWSSTAICSGLMVLCVATAKLFRSWNGCSPAQAGTSLKCYGAVTGTICLPGTITIQFCAPEELVDGELQSYAA